MAEWRIEPLRASHERGEFSCGKALLDDFLRLRASQYEKRRLGRTYVALFPGATRVAGYGDASDFYTKYGFVPLADNDLHLFLPIRTIEEGSTEGKSETGGQPGGTSPNVPGGP